MTSQTDNDQGGEACAALRMSAYYLEWAMGERPKFSALDRQIIAAHIQHLRALTNTASPGGQSQ